MNAPCPYYLALNVSDGLNRANTTYPHLFADKYPAGVKKQIHLRNSFGRQVVVFCRQHLTIVFSLADIRVLLIVTKNSHYYSKLQSCPSAELKRNTSTFG